MNPKTGGPAFPTSNWQKMALPASGYHEGMTLRDYFAAKALQALIPIHRENPDFDMMKSAYRYADAMIEAREQ